MQIFNMSELELVKATDPKPLTRTQAKGAHKDLPPGGVWRTMNGHHIYIKDGKVLAGAVPGMQGAKKATKAHLAQHQATVDAEAKKGAKANAKTSKPKKGSAANGNSAANRANKPATTSASGGSTKTGSAKAKGKPALVVEPGKGAGKRGASKDRGNGARSTVPRADTGTSAKTGADTAGKGSGGTKTKAARDVPAKPAENVGAGKDTGKGKKQGAPKAPVAAASSKKKKVADVRTEAQKNRDVSYDVGEELAGARKHEDHARDNFQGKPTLANLDALEKISPKLAHNMVSKDNLLPKGEKEVKREYHAGTDLKTFLAKQMVYGRVVQRPADTPEARKQYVSAVQRLQAVLEPVRNFDDFKKTIHDMGEWLYAHKIHGDDAVKKHEERIKNLKAKIGTPVSEDELKRPSWLPAKAPWDVDAQRKRIEEGRVTAHEKAKERLEVIKRGAGYNFGILGDSFSNFFRDQNSLNSSLDRVAAKVKEVGGSWDTFLSDDAKKALEKPKGESKTKIKWERVMPKVLKREGGRKTPVSKPEDAVKAFGFRGVQFGHWVDDTSGKYHLEKASEAFHDMSDILGLDDKDISMNGRIGMAFGARGKGSALAHYEPENKVINLTKEGGAGSLAHEWGHALDNLLWEHSHDFGKGSIGYASEGDFGKSMHPTVAYAYNALRKVMSEGDATEEVERDGSKWGSSSTLERHYSNAGGDVGKAVATYLKDAKQTMDGHHRRLKEMGHNPDDAKSSGGKSYAKSVRTYKQAQKNIPQAMMHLHEKKTGVRLSSVMVPNGKSWFKSIADSDFSGYLGSEREMFARAFEAYLEDKLHDSKRRNDYLVTGTKAGSVGKGKSVSGRALYQMLGMHAVYPQREERQRINNAMGQLLESIKYSNTIKKALEMELLKDLFSADELRKKAEEYALFDRLADMFYLPDKREAAKEWMAETWNRSAERLAKLQARRDPDGIESALSERSAYDIDHETDPSEVIYIPVNRLSMVYQTDEATDWDKVRENMDKMRAGVGLKPAEIGYDYDVHDGHHRWIASKELEYTHQPCVVKGKDEAERQAAIARYRELWKALTKSVVIDPVANNEPFEESQGLGLMYRGVGQKELEFVLQHGFIQTKGKGNDDDKSNRETCFATTWQQAEGYARSNYVLYNEPAAYVLVVPRPPWVIEDEHGELISDRPVPFDIGSAVFIPNPDDERID